MSKINDGQADNNIEESGWPTLWRLVAVQRIRLSTTLLFTLVAATCELLPFWILFQAIAAILNPNDTLSTTLYQLAGWMLFALLLKTFVYGVAYYLSHQAAFLILAQTRRTLVTQLAWAPVNWLQRYHSGQLKQAVLQDIERVEQFVAHHTVEVMVAVFTPLLVTAYLLWIDWRLALAALVTAPLAMLSSMLFMRGTDAHYDDYSRASAELNGATVEYLRNMPVMKLFRQHVGRFQAMAQRLSDYYTLTQAVTKLTVPRWALFVSLLSANLLFILPLGAWLYANNAVSVLDVVMVTLLGAGMLRPLLKISHFFSEIREVLAGVRRLNPILTTAHNQQETTAADLQAPFTVAFRDVAFGYDSVQTVQNINLTLVPQSITVLIGASGAGKSTLAQLLGGLLLPNTGHITINNVPIHDLSNGQRAALIAVATQEVFLFKGTIRENLQLARPHVQAAEMSTAVKVAQAEKLIASLPDGYDTLLHEQGIRLSGGEKQRIALARTLLADTPVLVLDEATAFADNLTQSAFYRDLKMYYPDKTLLVIAHRTYGLETADQIVVLDHGQIQDMGTHHQLLECNTFYQNMWQLQQASADWSIGSGKNLMMAETSHA